MLAEDLLEEITNFYLKSREFNGLPISVILKKMEYEPEFVSAIQTLVKDEKIELQFGDKHPNPHIKAYPADSNEEQIEKLNDRVVSDEYSLICAYPTEKRFSEVVSEDLYKDEPYTRALALGSGQLEFVSFDLSILEIYRSDPRYFYRNNDVSGLISVHDEFYESDRMSEKDQILLETFGFSFDKDKNIYVAVFLRYLANLSSEHQNIWKAKEIDKEQFLHPDYLRISMGYFRERLSIFEAICQEISLVNELVSAIGFPKLFLKEITPGNAPPELSYLIRPTQKEFYSFILTLDKIMSENLNRDFFKNDLAMETEQVRRDGKITVSPKGTIQLLGEWLEKCFETEDRELIAEMLKTFKEIRKLRQKPAHKLDDNKFDIGFYHQQRSLARKTYRAIKALRCIFENYPLATPVEVNDYLANGLIWPF